MSIADWKNCDLGDALTLQRGFDLPRRMRREGKVPVVSSSGISGSHDSAPVSGPGIVTGRYGTIGEVFYITEDFWPLNTTLFVRDFKGNDPLYIAYLLRTVDFATHSGKSGVPGVNRNDIHKLQVTLPSLAEQRAIAEALSDVDSLLGSLDALIAKKRAIKQAAMQQLLTGKTRLSGFSGEWETKQLGQVLTFQVGFPFSSQHFTSEASGRRLVKNRDLKADDEIVYYNGPYSADYLVCNGDVLIGMDGDFLPCVWSAGEALLNQRVGRVRPRDSADIRFIYYFLIEPLKEIERSTSSTTVKHLSHGDVECIVGRMPEGEEQKAIATILCDMDAEIAAVEARRDKTHAIKEGMMQQLLTGQIRLVEAQAA